MEVVLKHLTKNIQPSQSGWYDTDNGELFFFFDENQWSCRDDRISEEYPKWWLHSLQKASEITTIELLKSIPSDKQIYEMASKVTREIKYPLNNTPHKLRKQFKRGADYIINAITEKL